MTTLAANPVAADAIGVVLMLVFAGFGVVRWIKKQMDEAAATQERRRQQIEQQAAGGGPPRSVQTTATRPVETTPRPVAAGGEPGNMTLAERIERARARLKYEERAQALRREQEAARSQQSARPPQSASIQPPPARVPVNRQETERLATVELKRKRAVAARRAVAASDQQKQAHKDAIRQADTDRRVSMDKPIGPAETPTFSPAGAQVVTTATQPVKPGTVAKPVVAPATAGRAGMIMGRSLREAMVLREILDPPLALRESHL